MSSVPSIALYWLPLGAGGRSVRWNGRVYEAVCAIRDRRHAETLFHSALVVNEHNRQFVIEMAPVWNLDVAERGVVREGPVGAKWLGRLRSFRYEVRLWQDGQIPDIADAVESPQHLDGASAAQLLGLVPTVPALTWGRDELGVGDMWNSNSLISWLIKSTHHDMTKVHLPSHGRAPGWNAGLALASLEGH